MRLDERIPQLLRSDAVLTVADGRRYLLLELPHEVFIDPEALLRELASMGVTAIITHPERHTHLARHPEHVRRWVEHGPCLQITAGSFGGDFGRQSQAAAWAFLHTPMPILVAADAHDTRGRAPRMSEAYSLLAQQFGYIVADILCVENPRRVIEGRDPWQGCDILPDVFARVKHAAPEAAFLMVGPFPSKTYRRTFTERLVKHGIHSDCHWTGPVGSDLVPDYVHAMDICVMPDTTHYCSPMKLFEYGACGKAVVMPRRRPIEGVICHGRNGLLFEPGSSPDMAAKIVSLAADASLRASLGGRLQQDISARHTYVDNVERILEGAKLSQCLGV